MPAPSSPIRPPRPLSVVAGHLALDFANTVDDPGGPGEWDHLGDHAQLLGWARQVGALASPTLDELHPPTDPARVVRRAHALRRAVVACFDPLADAPDAAPPEAAWRSLRPFVAAAVAAARPVRRDDALDWEWTDVTDPLLPLHPVAAAAGDLVTDPRLGHLKRCGNCPWLFLDLSRNHSRRWCDMDDCGRAVKIQKYVRRRRERSLATRPPAHPSGSDGSDVRE